jgi:cyclase
MTRATLIRLSAATAFLSLTWFAYTQTQAPKLTINKVKEDLYNIEGDGGNVGVMVTNEGVILIDDKFEQDHDEIVARVKSVTSQPIKYVISTHYHGDHSGGNAKFLPMAEILSTSMARARIVEQKQAGTAKTEPGRIAFNPEISVFLGGKEVRARFMGRGHTDGDAIIYFPALKTIHTGDLMAGTSPLIDYPGGGSVVEWTKTLDAALQLDFDTVIPGHGAVTDKAGLKTYRDNIEKLRVKVSGLVKAGKSQDEVGKMLAEDFKWKADSLNMKWSLPGFMTELK